MFCLVFKICFQDVHKSPIYHPDKLPSVFATVLAEQSYKFSGGCNIFYFTRKITSCACLLGLGLKVIFQWFAQAFILLKSLFKLVADKFITEKKWNTVCKEPDICCEAVCKVVYID